MIYIYVSISFIIDVIIQPGMIPLPAKSCRLRSRAKNGIFSRRDIQLTFVPPRWYMGLCVTFTLSLSRSLSHSLSLSFCLSLSLSLSLSFCLSLSLSLSVSAAVFLCLCLSLYLSVYFTASVSVSLLLSSSLVCLTIILRFHKEKNTRKT